MMAIQGYLDKCLALANSVDDCISDEVEGSSTSSKKFSKELLKGDSFSFEKLGSSGSRTPRSINISLKRSDSVSSHHSLKNAESMDSIRSRQGSLASGQTFMSLFSALLKGNKGKQSIGSALNTPFEEPKRPLSIEDFDILKPISRGAFG